MAGKIRNSGAKAVLRKGQGREFKAGGAWIYDNEIDRVEGSFENGDIIELNDFDGFFIGYGFINMNSKIRVRIMSRKKRTSSIGAGCTVVAGGRIWNCCVIRSGRRWRFSAH